MKKTALALGLIVKQVFCILASWVIFLTACGSLQKQLKPGEQRLVEKSRENQPEWLKRPVKTGVKEDYRLGSGPDAIYIFGDRAYFVGQATGAPSLEDSSTDARMDGVKAIAIQISQEVKQIYKQTRTEKDAGDDKIFGYLIKEQMQAMAFAVVAGMEVADFYWEKYEQKDKDGKIGYSYNYAVLLAVPKKTLARAVDKIMEQLKTTADE